MRIHKIILDDGTECKYEGQSFADFKAKHEAYEAAWRYNKEFSRWEMENILPNLVTDLEEYAKHKFNLIEDDDFMELDDYPDDEIVREFRSRRLTEYEFDNSNIVNQDFVSRIVELSNRGDDNVIDQMLATLEKIYNIK